MKASTMSTQLTLTENQFDEQYPLITNHLDKNAAWDGHQFETFGAEHDFVRKQDPATVWTIMDDDNGNLCVSSGYHFVNRIGYLISTKPLPSDTDVFVELEQMNDDPPLRLLVCGDRDYADVDAVDMLLSAIQESLGPITCIIHGAASGADTLAKQWALKNNIEEAPYPADWSDLSHPDAIIRTRRDGKRYDAKAGHRRNQRMLDEAMPTLVAAFPGGKGTADMVRRARATGLHVIGLTTSTITKESAI